MVLFLYCRRAEVASVKCVDALQQALSGYKQRMVMMLACAITDIYGLQIHRNYMFCNEMIAASPARQYHRVMQTRSQELPAKCHLCWPLCRQA